MDQINMFDEMYEELPKTVKIDLGTFFTGIGSPEKAFKRRGVKVNLKFFSEIDKHAIKSYTAIHDESKTKCLGSISEIYGKNLPYCDMWFGGFPCQDISLAGNGKGFSIESETRSSLGWEMIRLLKEVDKKPMYVVFENVAAIFNNKHRHVLNIFKQDLEELGYTIYNKLINAKNHEIPQNRNRYFLVAILGQYSFNFPKSKKLVLKLEDLLENEVDDKYFLNAKIIRTFLTNSSENYDRRKRFADNISKNTNIANSITTRSGDRVTDNFILIPEATIKGYSEAFHGDGIYINRPHQKRGVVQKNKIPTLKTSAEDIGVVLKENDCIDFISSKKYKGKPINNLSKTIQTIPKIAVVLKTKNNKELKQYFQNVYVDKDEKAYLLSESGILFRIRKLTPKECFRVMGFDDEDFEAASKVCSSTQLYKQAGNSIVVNVLEDIFAELLNL